ncbi:hypothetical protein POQMFEI_00044 [Enterococcus phage vB_OCPT_CCS2]|nr:hypothetical protein POQMFEI_00044 [Enterococcus phage vB_OCPT_CCS2]WDS60702.1 hypothetical protein [Enterococcus phage vB_EfKS5]
MKFKVGDTVTVRKDLKTGWYGAELVVPDMLDYKGITTNVKKVYSDGTLAIDNGIWKWTPEMFEETTSEITLEIGYRYLTDTIVQASHQTVIDDDFSYENACEQFLEEYMKDYGSVEGVDICFVREAFDNA